MGYSRQLGPPIVAAAVATLAFTNFATMFVVKATSPSGLALFEAVWPILLTSTVATILTMSMLYRALLEVLVKLEAKERSAKHQAAHDHLTGLVNRTLLEDRVGFALKRLQHHREPFGLLLLDLDRFKGVNDTLGHHSGDFLLRQVGDRLRSLIRESDTIARIGGDEFVILQSRAQRPSDVENLCERLIRRLSEPYKLEEREAHIGVSVGAVIVRDHATTAAELLRKADITMYKAKDAGRNCYRLFCEEMDAEVQRKNIVQEKLRGALENENGLALHYQPQLSADGRLVAVEGLLRWTDRQLGELSPGEVIPVAEECGLIERLGELTFRDACRAAKILPGLVVAVNMSPLQIRERGLATRLRSIADQEGIDYPRIEIELTESVLIEHADVSVEVILQLRDIGFRIALDDFGTGYSSLSYLRRFPVDKIKLDQSFFSKDTPGDSLKIVSAAVAFGHALNLEVVAEGISSKEQEDIALKSGCDAVQGFYYSPAIPLAAVSQFCVVNSRNRAA